MQKISSKTYFVPALIFFFFLGFYLFTTKGVIYIGDGMVNFQTTRAIVEDGSLAIDCNILEHFVMQSPNGRCYSKYDVGLSLTAVPLYWLGRTLGGYDPADIYQVSVPKLWVNMLAQIATAATCAFLYILCFHISRNEMQAFGAAFLYGIATIAWPYAGIFFSQPLIALMLTLAVTLLVKYPANNTFAYLGTGLALGWACVIRLDTVPLAFVVTGFAIYCWWKSGRSGNLLFKNLILLGFPILLAIITYLYINSIRTGDLLQFGYANEGWTTPFFTGLYGLIASPGRGLLFYSPLTLIALIGLIKLWQQGWHGETLLIFSLFITQILTYASWWAWEGGETWGPRFLISSHALLMVGLLPWISKVLPQFFLAIALVLGFVVQIIGTATEVGIYLERAPFTYEETLFKWQATPIWGQFQDLLNQKVSFLLVNRGYGLLSTGMLFLWLTICLILMFVPLWLLRHYFSQNTTKLDTSAQTN